MISFDEASHIYRVAGVVKPSVTQVLSFMGVVSPFCRSIKAANLGTELHSLLEDYDRGVLIEDALPEEQLKCLEMYRSYKRDLNPVFSDIEEVMFDEELNVCGKADRAGTNPDFIMDIKTGAIPDSARLQTAGYARMRFPLTYELAKRYCVQVNPKLKTYKIKAYDDPRDYIEWENLCKNYWAEIARTS